MSPLRHRLPRLLLVALCALACAACLPRAAPDAATAERDPAAAALSRLVLDATAFDAATARAAAPAASVPAPAPARASAPQPQASLLRLSVYFDPGSARLAAPQLAALEQAARPVAGRRARWRVTARTDPLGSAATNDRLARARAAHVLEHLQRLGVDRDAVTVVHAPAARDDPARPVPETPDALARERRVDLEAEG